VPHESDKNMPERGENAWNIITHGGT